MATATFDESGNITATGKEAMPNVAEGLGASNIKGEFACIDCEADRVLRGQGRSPTGFICCRELDHAHAMLLHPPIAVQDTIAWLLAESARQLDEFGHAVSRPATKWNTRGCSLHDH